MKCPHCSIRLPAADAACCECGFSARTLNSYLGDHWVRLERIIDASQCLRLEDRRRCELLMDDFERAFPQVFLAVYMGSLPAGLNVAELGFWLLNQGAFNTPSIQKRNDFGVVMVVDPSSKSLGLSLGYSIEAYFDEKQVVPSILKSIATRLRAHDYGRAIEQAIIDVSRVLRKSSRQTPWKPDLVRVSPALAVEPLRKGHQDSISFPRPRPLAPT
ncbi:MAG: hypothetical protein RIS79_1943 [Verrucomicrobiota bacterium]|jgi:hypothetical protein